MIHAAVEEIRLFESIRHLSNFNSLFVICAAPQSTPCGARVRSFCRTPKDCIVTLGQSLAVHGVHFASGSGTRPHELRVGLGIHVRNQQKSYRVHGASECLRHASFVLFNMRC
jgi:hypothetical protein